MASTSRNFQVNPLGVLSDKDKYINDHVQANLLARTREIEKWKYGRTVETVWGAESFDKVQTTLTTPTTGASTPQLETTTPLSSSCLGKGSKIHAR